MNFGSRIIPGALNNANKDAIDWSFHGLLAYGCQSTVVILDPQSFRVIQCLEKNHDFIVKVKWFPEKFYHNFDDPYTLKLAAADSDGNILVWDVYKAAVQSEFRDGTKAVSDMIWYSSELNPNLLLTLHAPNLVTLWNTQTGNRVWRVVYEHERTRDAEIYSQLVQDPFNHQRAILLGQTSLTFIEDFSPTVTPTGQSRRYFISNSNSTKVNANPKRSSSMSSISSSGIQLTTRLKAIIEGSDSSKQDENVNSNVVSLADCIEILFHPMHRHLVLIIYPREILMFDLQIFQTVGNVTCEKSSAAFYKIYACTQRDQLICFHESGTISVRNRHLENNTITALQSNNRSLTDHIIDLTYDLVYYSDGFRLVKNTRICSFSVSPNDETKICVILTDGKVLFWNLDHVSISSTLHNETNHSHRLPLNGLMLAAPPGPYVMQMCPPMTVKNCNEWKPYLALGCPNGDLVVLDLQEGTIQRQLAVHSYSVRD